MIRDYSSSFLLVSNKAVMPSAKTVCYGGFQAPVLEMFLVQKNPIADVRAYTVLGSPEFVYADRNTLLSKNKTKQNIIGSQSWRKWVSTCARTYIQACTHEAYTHAHTHMLTNTHTHTHHTHPHSHTPFSHCRPALRKEEVILMRLTLIA